ncbi:substrate-binding periplasmic protein [Alteromonas sp. A079]|uniref:substrate-binding periplasmic protein n=1 Tax=Alteromonas sp. A079 TaxID=3410268 RepID=UPI003BA180EA
MNRYTLRHLLIVTATFLYLMPSAYGAETTCDRPLIVGYSGDWIPYFSKAGTSYGGTDFHLLRRTLVRMGCTLNVLPMTEARSLIEQKKGTFDISIGASLTKTRQRDFIYSSAYRREAIGLLVRNHGALPERLSLKSVLERDYKIALNKAGYFGPKVEVARKIFSDNFRYSFDIASRLTMLLDGDVDAVIDDYTALCIEQERLIPSSNFILLDETLHESDIYFIFSKITTSEDFVARFNIALAQERLVNEGNVACTNG